MRTLLILFLMSIPLAAQTATVEGTVTDTIRNKPVRKAGVRMYSTSRTGSPPRSDVYTTETDDRGHFLIRGVPPGKYRAQLWRDGFIFRLPESPAPPLVTLEPGERATLDLQMIPAGVVTGRVLDTDGEPIRNASVEALQYAYTAGGRQLSPRGGMTGTNDRGEYRLYNLPPGSYYLRATARPQMGMTNTPGEQIRGPKPSEGFAATYFPSVRDASQAAPLEVAAGAEVRDVIIRLWSEKVYSVTVKIPITRRDSPRNLPMFSLERRDASGGMNSGQMSTSDGSNDITQFPSLLPGPYVLTAVQPDPANREKRTYAREVFDVVDRDVELSGLNFVPGMDIPGKVKVDGEAPFEVQAMRISLQARSMRFRGMAATGVSPDGTFTLRDVVPDINTLQAQVPAGAYLKSVKVGENELAGLEVDLSGGDSAGPIAILLGTDGGRIEGAVVDAKEAPAPLKGVMLVPDSGQRSRSGQLKVAMSDDQGKFVFRDVPPGEYRLFAWADGSMSAPQDPEFRRKFEDQSVPVTVEANSRKTVSLKAIVTAAK